MLSKTNIFRVKHKQEICDHSMFFTVHCSVQCALYHNILRQMETAIFHDYKRSNKTILIAVYFHDSLQVRPKFVKNFSKSRKNYLWPCILRKCDLSSKSKLAGFQPKSSWKCGRRPWSWELHIFTLLIAWLRLIFRPNMIEEVFTLTWLRKWGKFLSGGT